MSLKAVVDNEPNPQPESGIRQRPSDEPLAIRMPVDIRSASLTVMAGLAIVLVLQYAQAMIIPIVLAVLTAMRSSRRSHGWSGGACRARSPRL